MKKAMVMLLCFLLLCTNGFADSNKSSTAGVGNKAGLNKIGGFLSIYPLNVNFSFSHNFTKEDQIDLMAGYYGTYVTHGFDVNLGYLRTVYEPVLNGAVCQLEVGGGLGFITRWFPYYEMTPYITSKTYANPAIAFYVSVRWEIFFTNVFVDFSPGVYINLRNRYYYTSVAG